MTPFVIAAADGAILSHGRVSDADLAVQDVPAGAALHAITEAQADALRLGHWRWQDGSLVAGALPVDLEALRARTLVAIDAAAEVARLRFITAGAGQCAEYLKTEAEARAYAGTGDAAAWPYLAAEQAALASVGVTAGLADVAAEVIAQADAWIAAGAAIKALRRTGKMQVAAATTAAEIRAAATITWPAP